MRYVITCYFPNQSTEVYEDTLPTLVSNIATTWSKIPHVVEREQDVWTVKLANSENTLLATFKLQARDHVAPLPGHF